MVHPLLVLEGSKACLVLLEQEVFLVNRELMVGMDYLGKRETKEQEDTVVHKAWSNSYKHTLLVRAIQSCILLGYYGVRGPPGEQGIPGSLGPQGQRGNSDTCILNSQINSHSNC